MCFDGEGVLLTFPLFFFRLRGFLLRWFWLNFLPMLVLIYIVLACFCFKISLIQFHRFNFINISRCFLT